MADAHSSRAHTKISPSKLHRVVGCPGSVNLEAQYPDKTSPFAAEGTAAHELGEHCLDCDFDAERYKGQHIFNGKISRKPPKDVDAHQIDADMVSAVQTYVDYCRWFIENDFECELEQRFDIGHIVPGMEGTGDFTAYKEDVAHLHVVDYKHGVGHVVEPKRNYQLGAGYAPGKMKTLGNRPIKKVTLTVVQPRAPHPNGPIRSWETTPEELEEMWENVRQAAALAEKPDAPLSLGDHCTFCKAEFDCPARRKEAEEVLKHDFENLDKISGGELKSLLDKADRLEKLCKRIRERANEEARSGNMPDGYKFVAKRAARNWVVDEAKLIPTLEMLSERPVDDFYLKKFVSPPQFEKLIGKKNMAPFKNFISKESTGLVLVPEDDPRQGVASMASEEFDNMSNNT